MLAENEGQPVDDSLPTPRGEPLTDIGRQLSNVPAYAKYLGEFYADRQKALNEEGKRQELTLRLFDIDADGVPLYNDEGKIIIKSEKTFRRRPLTWKQVQVIEDLRNKITRSPAESTTTKNATKELYEKLALWCFGIIKEYLESCDFKELQFTLDAAFNNTITGTPRAAARSTM